MAKSQSYILCAPSLNGALLVVAFALLTIVVGPVMLFPSSCVQVSLENLEIFKQNPLVCKMCVASDVAQLDRSQQIFKLAFQSHPYVVLSVNLRQAMQVKLCEKNCPNRLNADSLCLMMTRKRRRPYAASQFVFWAPTSLPSHCLYTLYYLISQSNCTQGVTRLIFIVNQGDHLSRSSCSALQSLSSYNVKYLVSMFISESQ